ncbi:HupE/UreJ family protein [Methylopila musalis]|uniref:HupE/UreJ family protein n=1 Tax=Methylopila musalis TaxID=1134781 RepID=A0ABW3Z3U0_9HYPH
MLPTAAFAHVGGHVDGFAHGFEHPVGGADHVLAMVAVGVLAAQLGGRALWATPLAFMGMMTVGGALGMAGVDVPFVELGIGLSVLALGLVLAFGIGLSSVAAAAMVGFFAIFHGHAHGAEMPGAANALSYGLGFLLATGLLHLAGVGLGRAARGLAPTVRPTLFRLAGGAFAIAGAAILTGAA